MQAAVCSKTNKKLVWAMSSHDVFVFSAGAWHAQFSFEECVLVCTHHDKDEEKCLSVKECFIRCFASPTSFVYVFALCA